MDIDRNYDQQGNLYRIGDAEVGQEYTLLESSVPLCVHPLDDRYTEDENGSFGKDFLMICGVRDIKEGDKIVIGTDSYRVVGIEIFNRGSNQHAEAIIRIFNP